MTERKGQMNIKRHQVSRRRTRAWSLSPVIATQLALIMVLAGIGAAFALPQNTISNTAVPWAGTGSVTASDNFVVNNYELMYDSTLTQVTGVNLNITQNGGTSAQINVVAINGSTTVLGSNSSVSVSATGIVPVLFTSFPLISIDKLNVVLTE